jgi:hypothetical protein
MITPSSDSAANHQMYQVSPNAQANYSAPTITPVAVFFGMWMSL